MTGRRAAIAAIAGTFGSWTVGARAQGAKQARIAFLFTNSFTSPEARVNREAFFSAMRDQGYAEGRNLTVVMRSADGRIERIPALASEIAASKPEVIVTGATPAARALHTATTSIPIVAATMADPVVDGLAASLPRPGGNVTGLTFLGPELVSKRFEYLKTAVPGIRRVAVLWQPGALGEDTTRSMRNDADAAARLFALDLRFVALAQADAIPREIAALPGVVDAMFVFPSTMLFGEQRRIGALSLESRLPAIGIERGFAEGGGLIAFGANIADLFRRAAPYVVKILRGARPAELPIERPTKFDLTVNARTARALDIKLPASLLTRVDNVIQ